MMGGTNFFNSETKVLSLISLPKAVAAQGKIIDKIREKLESFDISPSTKKALSVNVIYCLHDALNIFNYICADNDMDLSFKEKLKNDVQELSEYYKDALSGKGEYIYNILNQLTAMLNFTLKDDHTDDDIRVYNFTASLRNMMLRAGQFGFSISPIPEEDLPPSSPATKRCC